MDFFQRQEIARRNTRWLEIYFALSVICTVVLVYVASLVVVGFTDQPKHNPDIVVPELWEPNLFMGVTAVTIFIIFCGSMYKISALSSGGSAVAEMLGGQAINSHTTDPNERRLLNVVEEMSIASGTPVPQIYLMPEEEGINAFAAGHSTNDMVICVTRGSLQYLTRDELQGVIGHEYSHILNGDMKLNLRLMGVVFGILCLALIGKMLLQTRGEKNPLPLIGIVLIIAGSIGVFFGKMIKSAVSRQREFLADAAAVQFTRNPAGLANALKKVGSSGSRIDDPNAEDASHFFFSNGLSESMFSWMSTHPPLEDRIKELDPAWDGKFLPVKALWADEIAAEAEATSSSHKPIFPAQFGKLMGAQVLTTAAGLSAGAAAITSMQVIPNIGAPTSRHLDYASEIMASLPESLTTAAHDPMSAVALIYALLLSTEETIRGAELQQLQTDPAIQQEVVRLLPITTALESRARLPLTTLSLTALRSLSPDQYRQFTNVVKFISDTNGPTDLFAYVLQKIVLRRLDPNFNPPAKLVIKYKTIDALLPDCAVLLSALAYAGQTEQADIENAFSQGVKQLGLSSNSIELDTAAYNLNKIDSALNRLNQSTPQIKKAVLNACAETVAADGVIEEAEAELLRAVADTLDCPIPPFLSV